MSSMVNDFIIAPALRQVRRFSFSSLSSEPEPRTSPNQCRKDTTRPSSQEDVISETEEDSYFRDDGDDSASQPPSSRSSITPNMDSEAFDSTGYRRQHVPTTSHNVASDSLQAIAAMGSQQNLPPPNTEPSNQGRSPASNANTLGPSPSGEATTVPSATPIPRKPLPEHDGMGALRRRILEIQRKSIPAPERARLMHELLMEGYTKSQIVTQATRPFTPSSGVSWEQTQSPQGMLDSFKFWQGNVGETRATEKFTLTKSDVKATFAPLKPGEDSDSPYRPLGCEHYKRNVKSQCSTCSRWYVCRFCHDKDEDHEMIAKDTKNMLCMFCGTAQKAGEVCIVCAESAALYYCSTCKLWNNDPDKSIYHCGDCGICRIGRGLGKDFFHCKKCCACLAINLENDHSDYMFNSPKPVCFMRCGHAMHRGCYEEHIRTAYKCPICSKSVVNMETQFRNLDIAIQMQPMPEKFQDTRAVVLCNDCSARTTTEYHWLGLKCAVCRSYNTSELQILGVDSAQGLTGGADITTPQSTEQPQSDNPPTSMTQTLAPRDIPRRRRHSSNLLDHGVDNSGTDPRDLGSFVLQERLVRSVSPSHAVERPMRPGTHQASADESDDEAGDFIGFWSWVPRSIKSNEGQDGESESDGESTSSVDDEMEDDDDEDDEEEISLFGHR
ncbi:CHY zinc finger domain protein [Apiospora phragmitis]|uniref:CHY zinc finger domain protein n=1 Tax=Apiospora phragmitis TaxID=2905665 RepID=A0ABR1WT51_9PEZI